MQIFSSVNFGIAQVEIQEQLQHKAYLPPRYKVVLHNDDLISARYVIDSLVKVVSPLSYKQAREIMLLAHTTGSAIVIVCPKETAEYYQEGLQRFGLTVSLERE